jgi:hypothetical protein
MKFLIFSPSQTFTWLHARITEEDGAFTVSVRLLNDLRQGEGRGDRKLPSTDMATCMIEAIAKEFCISQECQLPK